jgi:hypothetical protein
LERGDSGSKIDGQKIVLGIDKYLDEFADEVGGASWKVWVRAIGSRIFLI